MLLGNNKKLVQVLGDRHDLPDTLSKLVQSYLENRVQTTHVDGEASSDDPVISGGPQGSILGPHLFNAFISSVLNAPVSATTRLLAFADDLLIIKPIRNQRDVKELQLDIDLVIQKYSELMLSVNPVKSAFKVCSLASAPVNPEMPILHMINGVPIRQQQKLKYLGVTIDRC